MFEATKKWDGNLPLVVTKRIVKLREKVRDMKVIFGEGELYEVLIDNGDSNIVNLNARTCDCGGGRFQAFPVCMLYVALTL